MINRASKLLVLLFSLNWLNLEVGIAQINTYNDIKYVSPKAFHLRIHCERVITQEVAIGAGVHQFLEDKYGYLWMLADGQLFRSDGYTFKKLPINFDKKIHYFQEIGETIWLSSYGSILSIDHQNLTSKIYPLGLGDERVIVLGQKSVLELWVFVNSKGLYTFNVQTGRFGAVASQRAKNAFNLEDQLSAPIFVEGNLGIMSEHQQVWLAGKPEADQKKQKLYRFDMATGEWLYYPPYQNKAQTYTKIYLDSNTQQLWLTSWESGLHKLDLKKQNYTLFTGKGANHYGNIFTSLLRLNESELLLLAENGLYIFNHQNLQSYKLSHIPDDIYSPESGSYAYSTAYRTRQGIIWIGGIKALLKIDPLHQQFISVPFVSNNEDVNNIYYDKKAQKAYLTISDSLPRTFFRVLDLKTKKIDSFILPQLYENSSFYQVFQDSLYNFWLWDDNKGFFQLNLATKQITPIKFKNEKQQIIQDTLHFLPLREVIAVESKGNFWLASLQGLWYYQAQNKTLKSYLHQPDNMQSPRRNQIDFIFRDSRGLIWIGYSSLGVSCLNPKTGKWRHFRHQLNNPNSLNSDAVFGINEDKQGRIWIAGIGLCYFDPRTDKIHRIANFNGECRRPFFDSRGNLWCKVISESALGYLDIQTKKMIFFKRENGFDYTYFGSQLFQITNDDFLFGSGIYFNAKNIRLNPYPPNTCISSFKIFEKEPVWSNAINFLSEIKLDYTQNFISIEFASLNFTETHKNQYAYRLIGYDKDWVYVGNRRTAYYTGLKGGDYTLEYKSANNHGLWGKTKRLKIIITPPFWETTWFQGLIVLAFIVLTYALYWVRIRQIRKEANFRRRLAETEMAALRAQMNPHFIFNCLSSIHHFLLSNDAKAAAKYLTKFARLIRLVLENSREPKLLLNKELEAIQIYVEMERLRFNNQFSFDLNIEPAVDEGSIFIPPLLIQPYIENAIWHGLMQKESAGKIELRITQPQSNILQIEIEDDGIGRAKALELKSKSTLKNKSYGMRITMNRIEVINELYNTQTQVEIQDLYNSFGLATGTKVVIKIPV